MAGSRIILSLLLASMLGGCAATAIDPAQDLYRDLASFAQTVRGSGGPAANCAASDPRAKLDELVNSSATVADLSAKLKSVGFDDFWATDPFVIAALVARTTARDLVHGRPTSAPGQIDRRPPPLFGHVDADIKVFHEHLKAMFDPLEGGQLWAKLAADGPNIGFLALLIAYEREYFSGGFVTHFGIKLTAPQVGDGKIPDAAIADAATVFFEALFDYVEGLDGGVLLFADKGWNPKKDDPAMLKTLKWWGANAGAIPTATAPVRLAADLKTPVYNPNLRVIALVAPGTAACGVSTPAARAITTLANWFGRRLVVWNGALLENFSSINIGFVIAGASIAVGDNKTLVTLAKAAIGVIGRRAAEHALVEFFLRTPPSQTDLLLRYFPVDAGRQ